MIDAIIIRVMIATTLGITVYDFQQNHPVLRMFIFLYKQVIFMNRVFSVNDLKRTSFVIVDFNYSIVAGP